VKAVEEKELKGAGKLSSDANLNALVDDAAARHRVDPLLVHSVIQVESGYNKYAVSPKGAQGLMQLIPATARRYGVKNPFDPKENIEAGVKYLRDLQSMFGDDRLALAAYNAGEGAVTRYGWIPPYSETQNYVYQVGLRYGAARRAASATAVATPPPPKKVEEYVDAEGRVHLLLR
jgi:soluble lytic murein transglycosylase-like protein